MGWLGSGGRHKDAFAKFHDALDRCDLERFRQAWAEAAKLPPDDFASRVNPFGRFSLDAISARIRQDSAFRDRALDGEVGDGLFRGAVTYLALFYLWCDEFKVGRYVFDMNLARTREQGGAGLRDLGGKPIHPKEAAGLLAEAEAAVKRCAQATSPEGAKQAQVIYQSAIDRARAQAAALKENATRARSAGDSRTADGYQNDAGSFEALANDLERTRAERLKPCGQPAGAEPSGAPGMSPGTKPGTAPGSPPDHGSLRPGSLTPGNTPGRPSDPRNRLQFAIGGMFGNINVPSVGVGTQFDATLGREREIIFTPRNLSFAGGMAEVEAPLSRLFGADVPSPFSQMAFYAQLKGYSMWGRADGALPIGGNNVAFTYLFPNPATGTTGVLAGATGQSIDVKVNGEALQLTAGLKWPGPNLSESPRITTMLGFGAAYEYWDMGQEISQQSLTFPTVSSRTKLRIDEHFFAPYLSAGVKLDDGRFFGSLTGFVAPGIVVTDASARQTNLCGPCGNPGDRNFTLSRDFSDTRFSLKTGFNLSLGARVTETVTVQAGMKYVHTSETGFLRPPTTPSEQPVRLDYGSRNLFGGFLLVKVEF